MRVTALYRDEGTVVLFEGQADPEAGASGDVLLGRVLIAVDHRAAGDIRAALAGEEPVYAWAEPWQIIGSSR